MTDPKDPKFIVAEKGDWNITRGQLDTEISAYLAQNHATPEQVGPEKMPMLETAMLDNMILKKLLLDKAATMTIDPAEEAKEEAAQLDQLKGPLTDQQFTDQLKAANLTLDTLKQRIHEKILISKVIQAEALKNIDPTEQEIDVIYEKNKDRFVTPPQVRASRILVHLDDNMTPDQKAAKKKLINLAHARVVKGEDFSKVATELSEDRSSAPKGGDLGWFRKGENEPQFDEVVFATKKGTVTEVFETPLGYQFVKVTDTQPAGLVPIADARAYIAQKLRAYKAGQAQEAYSKNLLSNGGVKIYLVQANLNPEPGSNGPAPQDSSANGNAQPAPESAPQQAPDSAPPSAPADSTPPPPATN